MRYSDSLLATCKVLEINIPFEEGQWPSHYLGENYFEIDDIKEKIVQSGGDGHGCDFLKLKKYYTRHKGLTYTSTDLCVLYADWCLSKDNTSPDFDILQLPDAQGKMHLYEEMVNEFKEHYKESITEKGYLMHATSNTNFNYTIKNTLANEMMDKVCSYLENASKKISIISSLLCQEIMQEKWVKKDVEILSWEKIIEEYTKEVFTKVHFSKSDVCIMLFSLEYIRDFSQFLTDVCRSAEKQVIIICRPFDKDKYVYDRWLKRRFVLDFTEGFLVKEMHARNFAVNSVEKIGLEAFAYAYDFRKSSIASIMQREPNGK